MSEDKIGVGCIGVGGRGHGLLRTLVGLKGVSVRAVCDTSVENCSQAQKLVNNAQGQTPIAYSNWKELLESKEIDAVVSALPCDLHESCYLDSIAANKDVYGEKPMCLTIAGCNAVVEAAKKSDRIFQVGFQRRADPRFIETMGQIHAGELGELVEGRICWSNAWGPLYGWLGKSERSGDWMVEQAVHNWDVMNWANQCLPVRAIGMGRGGLYRDKQPERDVTDYYSAIVEYANGVIVNILHSWVAPGQSGAYNKEFNDEYTRLAGVRAGIDFNSGVFSYRKELNLPDRKGHTHEGAIDSTQLALQAFLNSVRTREQPVANAEHGRDSVLACLLVREAVRRGTSVTPSDIESA